MKKHLRSLAILVPAGLLAVSLFGPTRTDALTRYNYFGGKITKVTYCTCLYYPGIVLSISDKASDQTVNVLYSPYTSQLRSNYNIYETGPYVLGGFYPGGQCLDQATYYCKPSTSAPKPLDGTIDWLRGIGTSLQGGSSPSLSI